MPSSRPAAFVAIWFGQLVSLFGSQLGKFALGVWVYEQTRSTTDFALISFAPALMQVVVLPLAGSLVDRWDRRRTMLLCDLGDGLVTASVAALLLAGRLEPWHIWVATGLASFFYNFRFLAFTALTTVLVPREYLQRASALVQVAPAATHVLAPLVSSGLLAMMGLRGVVAVDLLSFLAAIGSLLLVRTPAVGVSAEERARRPSLLRDSTFGWHFIRERSGLFSLLLLDTVFNCARGMLVLFTPLVLALSNAEVLGRVLFVGALGMGLGSVLVGAWKGPRTPVHAVLLLVALQGLSLAGLGLAGASLLLITAIAFLYYVTSPLLMGCNQAIWQRKVPAPVQGRVFSIRSMVDQLASMSGMLMAGLLADRLFGPWLASGGAPALARLVAPQTGQGSRAVFFLAGLGMLGTALLARLHPRLSRLDAEVPDAELPPLQAVPLGSKG